jgi:hypothetical protein
VPYSTADDGREPGIHRYEQRCVLFLEHEARRANQTPVSRMPTGSYVNKLEYVTRWPLFEQRRLLWFFFVSPNPTMHPHAECYCHTENKDDPSAFGDSRVCDVGHEWVAWLACLPSLLCF